MKETDFKNKKVEVLGFGKSNIPLVGWLLDRGACVTVRDQYLFGKLGEKKNEYLSRGVVFICGEQYLDGVDGDYIFRTPGIKFDVPEIENAVKKGAVLTSEMELFFDLCPCKTIGVTGSDGKTTTTTLIAECLKRYYGENKVFVGGNIGSPLLPEVDKMTPDCFAVVELSSFQLQTMRKSPDFAIITNLAPNHLNYHGTMEEYVSAKTNIFLYQHGGRTVLNSKNEVTNSLCAIVPKDTELLTFAGSGTENINGTIYRMGQPYLDVDKIFIPGDHNIENYEGVIALIGDIVPREVIEDVAENFKGVEHRIQLIRVKDGISYYNSSIDSSPSRTRAALTSFKDGRNITVICGGRGKGLPLEPLCDILCKRAKRVVLTGEMMGEISSALEKYESDVKPEIYEEPDFTKAVIKASEISEKGDTVILSPACTSYDAFPNFEKRGERFTEIVNGL